MSKKENTAKILDIMLSLNWISDSLTEISDKENPGSGDYLESQLDADPDRLSMSLDEIQATLDDIENIVRCMLLNKGFDCAVDVAQYQRCIQPRKD